MRPAILILALLLTSMAQAQSFLIRDGKATGSVLIPASVPVEVQLAADELVLHLEKMTGAKLPITEDTGGPLPAGSVRLTISPLASKMAVRDGTNQGYTIDQTGNGVIIEGNSSIGVLNGTYDYLQSIGVRWYMPGEFGLYVPKSQSVQLSAKKTSEKPAFRMRLLWLNGNPDWHLDNRSPDTLKQAQVDEVYWLLRNRLQHWYRPNKRVPVAFPLNLNTSHDQYHHNIRRFLSAKKLTVESNPERFALVTGPDGTKSRPKRAQICFTHPDNIKDAIAWSLAEFEEDPELISVSLSLNDTGGICECDECLKANDGVNPNTVGGDVVVWKFMNAVAKGIKEKRPDRGIALFSTYGAMRQPPPGMKVEGNVLGFACHIDHNSCELDDPKCATNVQFLQQMKQLKETGAEIGTYDYTSFPMTPQPLTILNNVRTYKKFGLSAYTCETMSKTMHHSMVRWVQAQLAWNPDQDPRKLIEEYCTKFYGDAGPDVLAVVDRIEASVKQLPKITISGIGSSHEVMTDEVIAFGRERLQGATGKVKGIEADRLKQFSLTFEVFARSGEACRAFLVAMDDRTPQRKQEAIDKANAAIAYYHENGLQGTFSPMYEVKWMGFVKKLATNLSAAVDAKPQKALINAGEKTLIAELFAMAPVPEKLESLTWLPGEWKFRVDLFRKGETQGWMNPGLDEAKWATLATGFFDDQGFPHYEGTFWYRNTFDAPTVPTGKRLIMRMGALDDDGRIYINGKLAHERLHVDGLDWMRSFEFDITDFIKPGEKNTIAVVGRNDYGKGGLWKPVAVYVK
jgi:hypothetical protein